MQAGPFGLNSAQVAGSLAGCGLVIATVLGLLRLRKWRRTKDPTGGQPNVKVAYWKNNLSVGLAQPEAKKVVAKCLGLSAAAMYGRSRLARHQRWAWMPASVRAAWRCRRDWGVAISSMAKRASLRRSGRSSGNANR